MTSPVFDQVVPWDQGSMNAHQLFYTRRMESLSLREAEALERMENNFGQLVKRSQTDLCVRDNSMDAGLVAELISDNLSDAYNGLNQNLSVELGQIDSSIHFELMGVSQTIEGGFSTINDTIEAGFNQFSDVVENGFAEVSDLLGELSEELESTHADISAGFDQLGAIFDWGFSSLIAQAEAENENLTQIIQILRRPTATEARELFFQSRTKYRRGFMSEALESFLYLLEEKRYRIVLGTYSPIHIFIADIYLFEKKNFRQALRYYASAIKYLPGSEVKLKAHLQLSSAYCQYMLGDFDQARWHAKCSLMTCYSHEAAYQYARYSALMGDVDATIVYLKRAIQGDKRYVVRVLNEADFARVKKQILPLLVKVRRLGVLRKLKAKLDRQLKEVESEIAGWNNLHMKFSNLDDFIVWIKWCIAKIDGMHDTWIKAATMPEIMGGNSEVVSLMAKINQGYKNAIATIRQSRDLMQRALKERAEEEKKRRIAEAERLRQLEEVRIAAERRLGQLKDEFLHLKGLYLSTADDDFPQLIRNVHNFGSFLMSLGLSIAIVITAHSRGRFHGGALFFFFIFLAGCGLYFGANPNKVDYSTEKQDYITRIFQIRKEVHELNEVYSRRTGEQLDIGYFFQDINS